MIYPRIAKFFLYTFCLVPVALEARGSLFKSSPPVPTGITAVSNDVQNIWNANKDAVVEVLGVKKDSLGNEQLLFGTGFFIDNTGHILTTATVASETEDLWVKHKDFSYAAKLIGKDSVTNLAVLEVLKCPNFFQFITLPESSTYDHCACGELVLSIGCALGMAPAPTLGILSGENLFYGDHIFVATYLRSDIEICGGESGAPVFDSKGYLCGILIASLPELRSSFIIPSCALHRIITDIFQNQEVTYSAIGFGAHGRISSSENKEIVVSSLADGDSSGTPGQDDLKIGDIICKIDGTAISTENEIANLLFFKKPGETLSITVQRLEENPETKGQISITKEIHKTLTQKPLR